MVTIEILIWKIAIPNPFLDGQKENMIGLLVPCLELTLAESVDGAFFNIRVEFTASHIVPSRFKTNGLNVDLWRERAMKWQFEYQKDIFSWFNNGVTLMCESMKGKDLLAGITPEVRMHFWKALFNTNSQHMARAPLGSLTESVAIDDIFFFNPPAHLKWQ